MIATISTLYACPLCGFMTTSRMAFDKHVEGSHVEYWTYGKLNGSVQPVYKINELPRPASIHVAAQVLMDKRGYTVKQAYEHLGALPHR